jgi:hypothetical protein
MFIVLFPIVVSKTLLNLQKFQNDFYVFTRAAKAVIIFIVIIADILISL